jgi:hypothetical protein
MPATATPGSYVVAQIFQFPHQYLYYALRLSVIFLSIPIHTLCGGVQLGNNVIPAYHVQFILQ